MVMNNYHYNKHLIAIQYYCYRQRLLQNTEDAPITLVKKRRQNWPFWILAPKVTILNFDAKTVHVEYGAKTDRFEFCWRQ